MSDAQTVAFAQALGALFRKFNDRLEAAEQTIAANGLKVEVQAPAVSVEPQINVPEINLSGLVEALSGITTDNVAGGLETVSQAITALAEKEGLDVSPLVESQANIAEAVTGSADRLVELNERSIEAQAKTGDEISRLADLVEKSTGASQMQFNAVFEAVGNMQRQLAEQNATLAAPKRLTFGSDGKPDGVETVLRQ